MIEVNKNHKYINIFDNINEIKQYVCTRPRKSGRDNDSEEEDYGFYGTKSFDEAINKLVYGDEDLYNTIKENIKKLNIDKLLGNVSNRTKYHNRNYGCVPNVPVFLSNCPLNMINPERTEISHKILNIFLNIRVGGGVKGDDVVEIGSKYLAVIDLLEKAGYRCNLYSGVANSSLGSDRCLLMVRVKTDKEPFNLKKICFTIANPSMQRRIKFKWMEVNDCPKDFSHCGYGMTCENSDIKEMLDATNKEYIVWNYERDNRKFTVEKIIEELKKQGIDIG